MNKLIQFLLVMSMIITACNSGAEATSTAVIPPVPSVISTPLVSCVPPSGFYPVPADAGVAWKIGGERILSLKYDGEILYADFQGQKGQSTPETGQYTIVLSMVDNNGVEFARKDVTFFICKGQGLFIQLDEPAPPGKIPDPGA